MLSGGRNGSNGAPLTSMGNRRRYSLSTENHTTNENGKLTAKSISKLSIFDDDISRFSPPKSSIFCDDADSSTSSDTSTVGKWEKWREKRTQNVISVDIEQPPKTVPTADSVRNSNIRKRLKKPLSCIFPNDTSTNSNSKSDDTSKNESSVSSCNCNEELVPSDNDREECSSDRQRPLNNNNSYNSNNNCDLHQRLNATFYIEKLI